jgi:hypothetical protein
VLMVELDKATDGTITCKVNGTSVGSVSGGPTAFVSQRDALNLAIYNYNATTGNRFDASYFALKIYR